MNTEPINLPDDVVLRVRGVSKKFCRNLKRSMLYGMQDLARNMLGVRQASDRGPATVDKLPGCEKGKPLDSIRRNEQLNNQATQQFSAAVSPLRKDEFWALKDISFDLKRGECLGLIGRNGSGKTTLLRLLTGIFPPDKGEVSINGRVGAMIALGAGFHPHMTGRENIYLNGAILGLHRQEIDAQLNAIVDFAEIGDFIDAPVSTYSSGMCVRLGFSVATAIRPSLLLVDEVLAVGDVKFRMKCYKRILSLRDDYGVAIVLVSHNALDLRRVCGQGMLLVDGAIVMRSNIADVLSAYDADNALKTVCVAVSPNVVEIKGVAIVEATAGMARMHTLRGGDSMTLDITISANQMVEAPRVVVFVEQSERGMLGSVSSADSHISWHLKPGINHINLELQHLPLLSGYYSISVAVYGPNVEDFYDQKNGICGFQISEPKTDDFGYGMSGVLLLEHSWYTAQKQLE